MNLLLGISFVVTAVAFRFLPHPANFTPVGALFIFFAARFKLRWSLFAMAALGLSDLMLGSYDARLMFIVYASFAAMGLIAKGAAQGGGRWGMVLGILSGSVLFYVTTNFAVWALSAWYPHTFSGLMASYALALPFFRNALGGDLLWSGIFFGAYAWLGKRFAAPPQVSQQAVRVQVQPSNNSHAI